MPTTTTQPDQSAGAGTGGKPMTRSEVGRHASLVRWGKENPLAARLQAIRERRAKAGGGGGKGKAKAKGEAKQTPEQRQTERDAARAQEQADNREKVKQAMAGADAGLSPSGSDALTGLADGQQPNSTTGDSLAARGLMEKGEDGHYHLTDAGHGAANAMGQGDYQRTLDAINTGEKRAKAISEKEKAKEEKQGKGSGSGGKGKEKDKASETDDEKDAGAEKEQQKSDNRSKVGEQLAENDAALSARGLEALAALTKGDEIDADLADGLVTLGLAEKTSDGSYRASSLGRQAARAAERGDYGATVDAVSRAKERKTKSNDRDAAKKKRQEERRQREDERRAREDARRKQEDSESSEDDESDQEKSTRQTATKGIDAMSDYTMLVEDLTDLADELTDLAHEDAAIKAGRRHNASDQSMVQDIYEAAERICELAEALGAEAGEREVDREDDEAMGSDAAMYGASGKSVNYDQATQLVRDAWAQCAKPCGGDANAPSPWPQAVFDDGIVISQDGCLYFVPYARTSDGIAFAERDQWRMARQTYITTDGDVKARQTFGTRKGIEFLTDDLAVLPGYGVKATGDGDGWVGGYLVRFGGDGDLSDWRDVFTKSTDFGQHCKTDVWVHHRLLPGLGKRKLINQAEIGLDDEGVFIKHLLNLRSSYERKLYGMVQDDKLGWSSGTAPHLIERKALGDGRHQIDQWPLGLDASYTPMPAGGLGVEARSGAMKSLLADAGIDLLHAIYNNPEASDSDERERSDETKATTNRKRRLLLQSRLLQLQE